MRLKADNLPKGFKNTPVTKYLLTSIIASSTVTSLLTLKPYTHVQIVPHLVNQWQWWRIPIWMASYSNAGEVLFACLTIYNLRGIERLSGSRKYAVSTFDVNFAHLLVIPHVLIHYEFNPHASYIGPRSSTSFIKSIKLPSSWSNTITVFALAYVHSPDSSNIYSPTGCLDSHTIVNIRTHVK